MNGMSTTPGIQTSGGVFTAEPESAVRFTVETVANTYGLGEADMAGTELTNSYLNYAGGTYFLDINTAFGNLIDRIKRNQLVDDDQELAEVQQLPGRSTVAIYGRSDWTDYRTFKRVIQSSPAYQAGNISKIVVSEESGVSALARQWAYENGIPFYEVTAGWNSSDGRTNLKKGVFGNKLVNPNAGKARFQKMIEESDEAIVLTDSSHKKNQTESPENKFAFMVGDHRKQNDAYNVYTYDIATSEVKYNLSSIEQGTVDETIRSKKHVILGIPTSKVRVVKSLDELNHDLLYPFEGTADWGPAKVDLGIPEVGMSAEEEVRFEEAMVRFLHRVRTEGLNELGVLKSVQPGEIAGFIVAERSDGSKFYHPIRVFEKGRESGAPTDLVITNLGFDEATGKLNITWEHSGDMRDRWYKLLEYPNAAAKTIRRAKTIPDTVLMDGNPIHHVIAAETNATRRLKERRRQKLITLMLWARGNGWGYNIAASGFLADEPELQAAVLDGSAQIGTWIERYKLNTDIQFTPDQEMNAMMNWVARRCIRLAINPLIFFASHYNGEGTIPAGVMGGDPMDPETDPNERHVFAEGMLPSKAFFNFEMAIKNDLEFYNQFLRMMHQMNPTLCPDGIHDERSTGTLFDRELRVWVPMYDESGNEIGYELCEVFGGFHFNDEHWHGHSASGSSIATYSTASLNAAIAGGKKPIGKMLHGFLTRGNVTPERESYAEEIGMYKPNGNIPF